MAFGGFGTEEGTSERERRRVSNHEPMLMTCEGKLLKKTEECKNRLMTCRKTELAALKYQTYYGVHRPRGPKESWSKGETAPPAGRSARC